MTNAELNASWAYPDEKPDENGIAISHKNERQAYVRGWYQAMTAEQLDELNMLFNKVANVWLPEATVFKCAYINEQRQVKVVMK